MNLKKFLCLVTVNWVAVLASDLGHLKKILSIIQRRIGSRRKSLYVVNTGELQLLNNNDSLDSGGKYQPKHMPGSLIYGNLNNLGITHGKTRDRIKYSGFRRNSNLLKNLLNSFEKKSKMRQNRKSIHESSTDDEGFFKTRRKIQHRNRKELYEADDRDSTSSSSSEYEKNPGNPFTIHKNRYKQNWMWNHAMTGDHMNVDPKAPVFNNLGPTGAELFFGRKWWYYNQDDYVPFR